MSIFLYVFIFYMEYVLERILCVYVFECLDI